MARYRTAIIITVAWTGLAAPAAWAGPNLILNPGFEAGESPTYPGVGLYWETNDAEPHPDVDVLTTSTRHSGSYSQWLKANSEWDLGMLRQVSPYNSIAGGKTYRVSAWVKTANVQNPAGWYVFGVWFFNNDTNIGDSKMPEQETLNYDWREIAWTVVAPTGANRIAAVLPRHTDGDAWYDDISITEVVPGPPEISVSPGSFEHKIRVGSNAQADVLLVQNTGGGTLNYTITDNAGWLDCAPAAGASAGESDPITVSYTITALAVGQYQAAITVSDPAAVNPAVLVPVSLTVWTPGDLDYDNDVDQVDFGLFQACYSGVEPSQTVWPCVDARMDGDVDVDAVDFALFFQCLSGPGVPAEPDCAN